MGKCKSNLICENKLVYLLFSVDILHIMLFTSCEDKKFIDKFFMNFYVQFNKLIIGKCK